MCDTQYVSCSFSRRSVISVWLYWTDTLEVGSANKSNAELNFARVLTVVKNRRDYKLQVESYGVFGVAAVLMG